MEVTAVGYARHTSGVDRPDIGNKKRIVKQFFATKEKRSKERVRRPGGSAAFSGRTGKAQALQSARAFSAPVPAKQGQGEAGRFPDRRAAVAGGGFPQGRPRRRIAEIAEAFRRQPAHLRVAVGEPGD